MDGWDLKWSEWLIVCGAGLWSDFVPTPHIVPCGLGQRRRRSSAEARLYWGWECMERDGRPHLQLVALVAPHRKFTAVWFILLFFSFSFFWKIIQILMAGNVYDGADGIIYKRVQSCIMIWTVWQHFIRGWTHGLDGWTSTLTPQEPKSSFRGFLQPTISKSKTYKIYLGLDISCTRSWSKILYHFKAFAHLSKCRTKHINRIVFATRGKEWNQPKKNCHGELEPLSGSIYPAGAPPATTVVNRVLSTMKKPVYLLDITTLSQLRKDCHPSAYSGEHSGNDCSHWCLPGLPDTWNQLLYAALLMWSSKHRATFNFHFLHIELFVYKLKHWKFLFHHFHWYMNNKVEKVFNCKVVNYFN